MQVAKVGLSPAPLEPVRGGNTLAAAQIELRPLVVTQELFLAWCLRCSSWDAKPQTNPKICRLKQTEISASSK